MELQAVTGQLFVVDGATQETEAVPGLIALQTPTNVARGRQRDFLFCHLTLSGRLAETATLAQDLLDTIVQNFYQSPGSVTAGLRKAILAANKSLLALNLSGASGFREGAISCAVLRDSELFTAQVGQSLALLGHNFGIERLPKDDGLESTPLGRTAGLNIRYSHNWLTSGDMLLLLDPRLGHLPVQAFKASLIDTDVDDGLSALTGLVGGDSARLMLIEFTDDAPGYLPEAGGARPRAASTAPLAPPVGQPVRETLPVSTRSNWTRAEPTLPDISVDRVELEARRATSRAARGLSRLTGWTADVLTMLRPAGRSTDAQGGWAFPGFLAVVIPLLVATIVTGVYVQRGRVVRFSEIKQLMAESLDLARQAGAEAEGADAHYQRVVMLAAEAENIRAGDAEVQRLRQEALVESDALSGVTRLSTEPLYTYGEEVRPTHLALGDQMNGDIYVLDSAGNRIFRHLTDEGYVGVSAEAPELALYAGQVVGSHVVESIVDLAWRPRGNQVSRDGMAILDGRGALVTFHPNFEDTRAVTMGLASDWVEPSALAQFSERVYVLDPRAGRIWRYFPEGDGLTSSDDQRFIEFVDDPEMSGVVDFDIYAEDGSLVLLYADGRLRRYVDGRLLWGEAGLATGGLEEPLLRPGRVKIAGLGLNSSIYVSDPGTGRIVQFSIGGTFLAQYKATAEDGGELLDSVVDFDVADNPTRLFVITSNGLYLTQ